MPLKITNKRPVIKKNQFTLSNEQKYNIGNGEVWVLFGALITFTSVVVYLSGLMVHELFLTFPVINF